MRAGSLRQSWGANKMMRNQMRNARGLWGALVGGLLMMAPAGTRASEKSPPEERAALGMQVSCFGSSRFVYSPALTSTPQDVSVTHSSAYSGCLAVMAQGVASVSVLPSKTTFSGATCDDVLGLAPEQLTLVWNNGTVSVVSLAPAEVDAEATTTTVTFTGTVVSGRFAGMAVARASTYVNTELKNRCEGATGLSDTNVFSVLVLAQTR